MSDDQAIKVGSIANPLIIRLIESRDEILSHHPDCHLRLLIADLALLESVRRAAEQVFSWGIDIDVFIANAGVVSSFTMSL